MLVVMHSHATDEQVRAVCKRIESLGLKAHPIPGAARTAIGITGNDGRSIWACWNHDRGSRVHSGQQTIQTSEPRRQARDSIIRIPTPLGDVLVGGKHSFGCRTVRGGIRTAMYDGGGAVKANRRTIISRRSL
jgi:3-deoxy-7-phosphoheptulonate synthase